MLVSLIRTVPSCVEHLFVIWHVSLTRHWNSIDINASNTSISYGQSNVPRSRRSIRFSSWIITWPCVTIIWCGHSYYRKCSTCSMHLGSCFCSTSFSGTIITCTDLPSYVLYSLETTKTGPWHLDFREWPGRLISARLPIVWWMSLLDVHMLCREDSSAWETFVDEASLSF